MMLLDHDQDHWRRVFGLNGSLSLVLIELAALEETTAKRCLTPFELERFALFTSPKRKLEWLGGRIAAKQAAMSMICLSEGEPAPHWLGLEVVADPEGRPFIHAVDEPDRILPDISISHSRGLAVAMAAGEGRCGIDIQAVTPTVTRVRARFAGAAELTILDALAEDHSQAARLTLLWAAKEALKKAIGTKRLPGFLGLRLARTSADNCAPVGDYFVFDFNLPAGITTQSQKKTVSVVVLFQEGYGLAFTGLPKRYIK
jgi:phosphopantetheinyl transferase (holo-ACP synthase)